MSRRAITRRPRAFYQTLYDWLLATDLSDYHSGRVLEYTWGLIFGDSAARRDDVSLCSLTGFNCGDQLQVPHPSLNNVHVHVRGSVLLLIIFLALFAHADLGKTLYMRATACAA